jgi:NhaA family Na+:H+ antiporter
MIGAGALAGIGFTMSLYIAHKAFPDESNFAAAKVGIFLASLIAGGLGTALLWRAAGSEPGKNDRPTSTSPVL